MKLEVIDNGNQVPMGYRLFAENREEHDLLQCLSRTQAKFHPTSPCKSNGWGFLNAILDVPWSIWAGAGSSPYQTAQDASEPLPTGESGLPVTTRNAPSSE